MNLPKPQYSLRWLFVEMTLAAVAIACFAYFFRTPNLYRPADVCLPFFGFFLAAGSAVAGLVHWPVVGGAGLAVAASLWTTVLNGLSS